MAVLRWLGFALVAVALAVLPFTIWLSGNWGLISASVGVVGLVLLGVAFAGRRSSNVQGSDPD